MMHDISQGAAEQAFLFWKEHYNIISFNDYLNARAGKKKLPPKSLILTFDDGHKGNFRLLPLINKLQISVTIFLCSGIAGTNRHFWFLEKSIDADKLKTISDEDRIKALKKAGFEHDKEYSERQALSLKELEELKNSPFIDLQSHTRTHPVLTQCSAEKAFDEISGAKKELEDKLKSEITGFAYPNGDHNDKVVQMVKDAGYKYAITTRPGYNSLGSDIFRLKRLSVNDSGNIDEIVVKSSGVWGIFKKLSGQG
jgi:peptidoglycan/xylan/chitin deacetylase (PgdA/CDA1 family)